MLNGALRKIDSVCNTPSFDIMGVSTGKEPEVPGMQNVSNNCHNGIACWVETTKKRKFLKISSEVEMPIVGFLAETISPLLDRVFWLKISTTLISAFQTVMYFKDAWPVIFAY